MKTFDVNTVIASIEAIREVLLHTTKDIVRVDNLSLDLLVLQTVLSNDKIITSSELKTAVNNLILID